MEYIEKEMLINRIVSGVHIYCIDGQEYILRQPTRIEKYRADLIYQNTLSECRRTQIPTEESVRDMMGRKGYWTNSDEEELKKITEGIDELKIALYENFDKEISKALRDKLIFSRDGTESLMRKKSDYIVYTDTWVASCAKQRYLIGCMAGTELESMVDSILGKMRDDYIDESQFRELARTDPWRSIWVCKGGDVFGSPACDLSPEQHRLILYSVMYDRIYDSPERPRDEIVEDDDALDGWKLIQQKESKMNRVKKEIINDKLENPKIAGAEEVLVMVERDDELQAVNNLNDIGAKMIKRQRENQVKKDGEVPHGKFYDQALLLNDSFINRS